MSKRKFHLALLPQIIIAIILGIGAGYIFPDWLSRIFITFNATFSQCNISGSVDKFVFYRTAATVENEYFHDDYFLRAIA